MKAAARSLFFTDATCRELLNIKVPLYNFAGAVMQPGQYQFPFSFALPVSAV